MFRQAYETPVIDVGLIDQLIRGIYEEERGRSS